MQYKQLTKEERYYIECRKANNISIGVRALALEMKRSPSTISRELKRNLDPEFGFYSGIRAQSIYLSRRKTVAKKSLAKISDKVRSALFEMLSERTSPEQVCGRLKRKYGIRISHVTLYRYINDDRKNGGTLYLNLRHGGKKYRRKDSKYNSCTTVNKKRISERTPEADNKKEAGHWEIDTVVGVEHKSYLLTLTDKATKFEIIRKIPNKEAATVLAAIQNIVATTLLPFKTITADNGTEFAEHQAIETVTNAQFYFANPYHSWERGLNEHQNGLIRDFMPKKTDFRNVNVDMIRYVENNLNNRPRKALDFLTPAEAMFNYVNFGVLHFN
jgi:IS30 family transposase